MNYIFNFTDKYTTKTLIPDEIIRTTCTYCGVGCQLDVSVINGEIKGIQAPKTAEELDKIKRARTLRLPGQYETLGALMGGIEDIVSNERDFNYLNTLADKRNSVTLDEVRTAAKEYIDPNSWTWVIVGDLSKIEEGIRNLNIGPIEILEL